MKRIALLAFFLTLVVPAFSFFPFFYGARSLALGYSSLAFNYDANALFINPALLNSFSSSLGGYQYQNSYLDFRDISGQLRSLLAQDLSHFEDLGLGEREALLSGLKEVFSTGASLSGFQFRNPSYAGKGYAVAWATIDAAIVQPLANAVLDKPAAQVSNADIASLRLRLIGCHYTDYSLAIAFPLSATVAVGATVHYLKGRNTEFTAALSDDPFPAGLDARGILQYAWSAADRDFSKFNLDLGASAAFGPHFRAGLAVKNAANPVIATAAGELKLARRLIAGLSFRPDGQLGIYLDIDVARGDLFQVGAEAQPLSLGVEKGLFQNKLFLRAGLGSDLAAKYFIGRRSNALYGLGFGFNLGNLLLDLAMGLDALGRVKNLGISGFYLLKGKN